MPVLNNPEQIEAESFAIVDSFLKGVKFPKSQVNVVRRIIHATSDPDYAKDLAFHERAVTAGLKAIKVGKNIVVDANMVKAGINKKVLADFGGKVICLIDDRDVIKESSELNVTRAILSMRKAAKIMEGAVIAIGNAPTALFELCGLIKNGKANPALVVGLPVGFVGAVESKKKLRMLKVPYITNMTRKGGSSAAAAAVNALLKIAQGR